MRNKISYLFMFMIFVLLIFQFNIILNETKKSVNEAIIETTQSGNYTVTKLFINGIYPSISNIIKLKENSNPTSGLIGDDLKKVDLIVRNFMYGTDILKIKLYSLNGMTLYSTENSQIGDDKSKNPSFQEAINGKAGSQITHRGKFSAIEGEVFDKDLVASYLPIKDGDGLIIGVAEIYTDRTPTILKAQSDQSDIKAYILLFSVITLILVFFMFWLTQTRIGER